MESIQQIIAAAFICFVCLKAGWDLMSDLIIEKIEPHTGREVYRDCVKISDRIAKAKSESELLQVRRQVEAFKEMHQDEVGSMYAKQLEEMLFHRQLKVRIVLV